MPGLRRILNERKSHWFLYSDGEEKATLEGELLTQKITFDTMDLKPTTLKYISKVQFKDMLSELFVGGLRLEKLDQYFI